MVDFIYDPSSQLDDKYNVIKKKYIDSLYNDDYLYFFDSRSKYFSIFSFLVNSLNNNDDEIIFIYHDISIDEDDEDKQVMNLDILKNISSYFSKIKFLVISNNLEKINNEDIVYIWTSKDSDDEITWINEDGIAKKTSKKVAKYRGLDDDLILPVIENSPERFYVIEDNLSFERSKSFGSTELQIPLLYFSWYSDPYQTKESNRNKNLSLSLYLQLSSVLNINPDFFCLKMYFSFLNEDQNKENIIIPDKYTEYFEYLKDINIDINDLKNGTFNYLDGTLYYVPWYSDLPGGILMTNKDMEENNYILSEYDKNTSILIFSYRNLVLRKILFLESESIFASSGSSLITRTQDYSLESIILLDYYKKYINGSEIGGDSGGDDSGDDLKWLEEQKVYIENNVEIDNIENLSNVMIKKGSEEAKKILSMIEKEDDIYGYDDNIFYQRDNLLPNIDEWLSYVEEISNKVRLRKKIKTDFTTDPLLKYCLINGSNSKIDMNIFLQQNNLSNKLDIIADNISV
jgi:hypothetical protein